MINGCYSNISGLPLHSFLKHLKHLKAFPGKLEDKKYTSDGPVAQTIAAVTPEEWICDMCNTQDYNQCKGCSIYMADGYPAIWFEGQEATGLEYGCLSCVEHAINYAMEKKRRRTQQISDLKDRLVSHLDNLLWGFEDLPDQVFGKAKDSVEEYYQPSSSPVQGVGLPEKCKNYAKNHKINISCLAFPLDEWEERLLREFGGLDYERGKAYSDTVLLYILYHMLEESQTLDLQSYRQQVFDKAQKYRVTLAYDNASCEFYTQFSHTDLVSVGI